MAFFAILFGYITSEYFKGFGLLFRYRHKMRFPWSFLLYAGITFILITIYWWNMWDRSIQMENDFLSFLEILVYPMLFYLISSILFRNLSRKDLEDLDNYFYNRKILLMSALGAYFLYDQVASYDKNDIVYTVIGLVFSISGILVKNKRHFRLILICGIMIITAYLVQSIILPLHTNITETDSSYTKVEHLTIFVSFIYGFVVAVYLKGWSYLIKDWRSIRYSWGHLIWTLFSFIILITVWWNSWIRGGYMEAKLVDFQISLLPPLLLYMISLVIFPEKKHAKNIDLTDYFDINRKTFLRLFLIYFIVNTLLSVFFKEMTFIGFTILFRVLAILVTITALMIRNRMFHKLLPYIAISIFIFYLVVIH